jgi:hypothetical protein
MAQSFYSQPSPYEVSRYEISLIITFKMKYINSAWLVPEGVVFVNQKPLEKQPVPSDHSSQEGETEGKNNTNFSAVVCTKLFGCF